MHVELELFRPTVPEYEEVTPELLTHCRKISNLALNRLVHDGILANKYEPLADGLMAAMTGVSQVLLTLKLTPEVEDFIHGSAELGSIIRRKLDEALRFNNMDDVKVCCCMAEVLIKGVSGVLGLPYAQLLDAAAKGATDLREILVASGHVEGASS